MEFQLTPITTYSFNQVSQTIIENMFHEHTARCYPNECAQKLKTIHYAYPIAMTKFNPATVGLISWTCLGVGLTIFTIYHFKRFKFSAEAKGYPKNEIMIAMVDILA